MKPNFNNYQEVGSGLDVAEMFPAKDQVLEVGDGVEGRYIEKKTGIGPNKSNVYVLDVGGQRVGIWGSTVIDSKFEKIAIGKMIALAYAGNATGKTGKTYKDFKVAVGVDYPGDEFPL